MFVNTIRDEATLKKYIEFPVDSKSTNNVSNLIATCQSWSKCQTSSNHNKHIKVRLDFFSRKVISRHVVKYVCSVGAHPQLLDVLGNRATMDGPGQPAKKLQPLGNQKGQQIFSRVFLSTRLCSLTDAASSSGPPWRHRPEQTSIPSWTSSWRWSKRG